MSCVLLVAADVACAQCPAVTQPTLLQVVGPGARFTGSSRLAADDGILVTDYTSSTTPFVQVHRLGADGWALDTIVNCPAAIQGLAVLGDTLVVRSGIAGSLHLNLFTRNPADNVWTLTDTVLPSDPSDINFGQGLAFNPSARAFALRSTTDMDYVLVYAAGDTTASLVQSIADPEPEPNHNFGFDMALDNDLMAVSALGDNASGLHAGAVYIFRLVGGLWQQIQKIVPTPQDTSDHFGQSVALHNGRLVVGAVHSSGIAGDSGGPNFAGGFVQIYAFNGDAFVLESRFAHPTNPSGSTAFGHDVAVNGDRALAAAFYDDLNGSRSGAVYVYDRVDGHWQPGRVFDIAGGSGGWLGSSIAMAGEYTFAVAPLLQSGHIAAVVFDPCAARSLVPPTLPCTHTVGAIFTFLSAYFQASPTADYNHDGQLTLEDLWAYLRDWFAGCP